MIWTQELSGRIKHGTMRILVLQTGRIEHFLAASQASRARYPGAELIGLVRGRDLGPARASSIFGRLEVLPDEADMKACPPLGGQSVDACVVPFESRLGV